MSEGSDSNQIDAGVRSKKLLNVFRIREAFNMVAKGIEVVHYLSINSQESKRSKKVFWMVMDFMFFTNFIDYQDVKNLRFCIGKERVLNNDLAKELPIGINLRDIADIREGSEAFEFMCFPDQTAIHFENCFSIIGSERTLCLEFPSKKVRDWLLRRFRLMAKDLLSVEELKLLRSRRQAINPVHPVYYNNFSEDEIQCHTALKELLIAGVQVNSHEMNGQIVPSIFSFEPHSVTFKVTSMVDTVVAPSSAQNTDDQYFPFLNRITKNMLEFFWGVEEQPYEPIKVS